MLRACPHHGFSELTQIDTFYNGLNEQDQDSLNATAGGNILSKMTRVALKIIENKSKVCYSRSKSNVSRVNTNSRDSASKTDERIDKLADQISNLVEIVNKQVITPAIAKAVEKTCEICGGAHAYYDCIATDSNQPSVCVATGTYNQVSSPNQASNQIPPPDFALVQNNQISFFQNQASTLSTLPCNTMPNSKGEMKAITTRSGLAYEGPSIPTNSPFEKVAERDTEKTTNKEQSNSQGSIAHIQPPIIPISIPEPDVPEKLGDPDKFLIPCDFPGIDVCQALADLGASINLMPLSIWKKLSLPKLTPTRMTLELADRSITRPKGVAEDVFVKVGKFHFPTDFVVVDFEADPRVPLILGRSFLRTGRTLIDVVAIILRFLILHYLRVNFVRNQLSNLLHLHLLPLEKVISFKEIENFLNDESIPTGIEKSFYDTKGDILYLEKFLNDDPSQLPLMDLKQAEETKEKSLIEKPLELELKELLSHLEYAFLEESYKLPVIIAKDFKDVEKEALKKVLKSHKRAIAWKISDIKGIDPRFCTHKILIEEDYKPTVQSQRRGGMTIVANENNELILTRLVTGWRVYIDYRKLNDATRTDRFSLPFMDQMDDFLVFGDSFSSCLSNLDKMLKRCEDTNLVDTKPRLLRWLLLLQEFDITIRDEKGSENLAANHLSRLENPHKDVLENNDINENFPLETLRSLFSGSTAWTHRGPSLCQSHSKEKRTVEENHGSWLDKLDDALWAFRTAFKTPTSCTPYKLVYGKSCHLPIELENKVYWALKHVNFDLKTAGDHWKLQLNELNELCDQAYENSLIYKERTKKLHDSKIKNRIFNVGDQVLLFNSRLKIFSGKLKTRWSGPFTITQVFPYGTVELSQPNGPNFKVNGHRVKHYFKGDIPLKVFPDLYTFPMDK
uniref:Reverse transcriptase domain-containing protein n=1 Tax=Tanacetum cinerariifolium TaxID=118510 RepID=A0A699GQT3_TANCI|nr:reverse transcriptase domain-containing protein [Tanacetum cinerariifolium]